MNITNDIKYPVLLEKYSDGVHPILGMYNQKEMTLPEILNVSFNHVISQGKPARIYSGSRCSFNTVKEGEILACGAAPFVSPKKKDSRMGWQHLSGYKSKRDSLICKLQRCHDYSGQTHFIANYKAEIRLLCREKDMHLPTNFLTSNGGVP